MVAKIMIDDNDSKLVSVVIPFFNMERCLSRAISSVISQTYENWEIILVDDGSTDGSGDIAGRYSREYPSKIRLFRQKNMGVNFSRNKAIAAAKGSFIAILDSDDRWKENFLSRTMNAFELCPDIEWVYVNAQRITEDGCIIEPSIFDDGSSSDFRSLKTRRVQNVNVIEDPETLNAAIKSTIKAGANSVVKRRVFEKVSYPSNIRIGGDRLLIMLAIAAGFRFGFIDEILLTVYHHDNNLSISQEDNLQKKHHTYQELIKVYECLDHKVLLDKRSKAIQKEKLSDLYFNLAAHLIDSNESNLKAIKYLLKSLMISPYNKLFMRAVLNRIKKLSLT